MKDSLLQIDELKLGYKGVPSSYFNANGLSIESGEIVVVLGANGAGKSTLIKSIANLLSPLSGEIRFEGKAIGSWEAKELSQKMALVLTDKTFSGMLSVEAFVAFGRYPFTNWLGVLKSEDRRAIEESIDRCGIGHLRGKNIDALSDGERQKVFLARALAQQSSFLILDEPTTHLDAKNTINQLRLLKMLSSVEGKTILFSSHQFDLALQIADKVWLIDSEKVHQIKPKDFYEDCVYQEMLLGKDYRYNAEQKRFSLNI